MKRKILEHVFEVVVIEFRSNNKDMISSHGFT